MQYKFRIRGIAQEEFEFWVIFYSFFIRNLI